MEIEFVCVCRGVHDHFPLSFDADGTPSSKSNRPILFLDQFGSLLSVYTNFNIQQYFYKKKTRTGFEPQDIVYSLEQKKIPFGCNVKWLIHDLMLNYRDNTQL
jgi:hypothetical protein